MLQYIKMFNKVLNNRSICDLPTSATVEAKKNVQ